MPKMTKKMIERMNRLADKGIYNLTQIAEKLGVHRSTVSRQLGKTKTFPDNPNGVAGDVIEVENVGEVRPDRMMELYGLDKKLWFPTRFNVSIGKYGPRGSLSCKRIMAESLQSAILSYVRETVKPLRKLPTTRQLRSDLGDFMVAWGLWDMHFGSYAWNSEVGADWDVDIACTRVANSIDDMVRELSPYRVTTIYMPIGNDFLHFDSNRMKTTFGEHYMDCDTRFARVYLAGLYSLTYMIRRATEICDDVRILYIPGNHDMSTAFTLCAGLLERFRDDDRVTVDLGANPRKYVLHGGSLVGFGHGNVPDAQLKLIFAEEAHDLWSQSTYREFQRGHTHQRRAQEIPGVMPMNGLTIRTNPTLCNNDFWHHSKALIGESTRSVEAWRYNEDGYCGSHVSWARGDAHPKASSMLKKLG